jgi:glycosyltransferase involved in cell wall biosynthesis
VRIAFVTETWLPSTDGIVTRLVATIRELRKAGHEVLVVAPRGESMGMPGVQVVGVPTVGWRFIYGGKRWGLPMPRVGRYLREFRPDVVHAVNPLLLGIAATASSRRQHIPMVASYHTDIARYAEFYKLSWMRPVIWLTLRVLHGAAQVNLVTSESAGAELRAHSIPRVNLWPRGVDTELFRPSAPGGGRAVFRPPPHRGRQGAARERPVALYVGRLGAEKGLADLAALAGAQDGFDLLLVGDGPARAELQRRLPAEATTFTGTLHGRELAAAYRRADVFVFPSTTETLGLVLLEALASGLPVIAAESPASRELLGNCSAARLFPAEQPALIAAKARELLASAPADVLAATSRRHVQRRSWASATETLLDYYLQAQRAEREIEVTEADHAA